MKQNRRQTRQSIELPFLPLLPRNFRQGDHNSSADLALQLGFHIAVAQQGVELIFRLLVGIASRGVKILELPLVSPNPENAIEGNGFNFDNDRL